MQDHVLALDQGTTSSRAIVFDREGRVRGQAQREHSQIFPRPGWVEHDPEEIASTQLAVAVEALARASITPRDVAAIGITNQRETVVMWDRATGKPVANAIVWQDRRTAEMVRELERAGYLGLVRERTGLVLDAYFSASKIRWLLDNVPDARRCAARGELAVGTIDAWIVWRLTGGRAHVTDVTNASRTLLCDIERGAWDPDLLELFDIPSGLLPEIVPSSGHVAETTGEIFGRPLPITGIAGDQQAALFGQLCLEPGMVKNTYGTGCFALTPTGTNPVDSRNRLLTTIAWQLAGEPIHYALEGSVFIAGAAVQWLRDGLGILQSAADINTLAASVPDSGGVAVVPCMTGLGAPYWDPDARGSIQGITRGTTAAHIARATLEAIACSVADLLECMAADSGHDIAELRVDGGAAASDLLLQFQADLLGRKVERPSMLESTALGAAYLAGLAAGVWSGVDELARHRTLEREFLPAASDDERERRMRFWRRAVERSMHWVEPED
jgi:glycerol kinase